eukprot:scaffold197998_cov34-Tisochrysis_lutea.AAC.6
MPWEATDGLLFQCKAKSDIKEAVVSTVRSSAGPGPYVGHVVIGRGQKSHLRGGHFWSEMGSDGVPLTLFFTFTIDFALSTSIASCSFTGSRPLQAERRCSVGRCGLLGMAKTKHAHDTKMYKDCQGYVSVFESARCLRIYSSTSTY